MAEQQTTWETTDDDLNHLFRRQGKMPIDEIAFNTLIQQRRIADAMERIADAMEILAGCVGSPLSGPGGPNQDGNNGGYLFVTNGQGGF